MKKKKQSSMLGDMFALMPSADQKSNSNSVRAQENKAADVIGGKRHAFSGSKMGLKSDCSSREYQLEAKQTEADSISLKLYWLKKSLKRRLVKVKPHLCTLGF